MVAFVKRTRRAGPLASNRGPAAGSSANLLFAGSGYLTQGELYKLGAVTTLFNLLLYLAVGTPWLMLVCR